MLDLWQYLTPPWEKLAPKTNMIQKFLISYRRERNFLGEKEVDGAGAGQGKQAKTGGIISGTRR